MQSVLKFPLDKVRRTTETPKNPISAAQILFFTGVRYERLTDEELAELKTSAQLKK